GKGGSSSRTSPSSSTARCLALSAAIAACAGQSQETAPPRAAPCGKDVDCKGARVCEAGTCVEPPPPAPPQPDAGPPPRPPGPPPYAMARGGPRHLGRVPGAAPAKPPARAWSVATGGAITASPVAGPDGTIYIGGHDRQLHSLAPRRPRRRAVPPNDPHSAAPAGPPG